jgi:aspartate racemase
MKTIGLIGGMSWESSLEYYRIINESIKKELGGLNSAKILMLSVNFAEVEIWMRQDRWDIVLQMMIDAGERLKRGGADFLLIGTNTVHLIAKDLEKAVGLPVLHIAEVTGEIIKRQGLNSIGVLGTRFTMEKELYTNIFEDSFGIRVLLPSSERREIIHTIIFEELCLGILKNESKNIFQQIIEEMASQGAQGVALACTEIPLLIKQEDVSIPVFDTTTIHAQAAVKYALGIE